MRDKIDGCFSFLVRIYLSDSSVKIIQNGQSGEKKHETLGMKHLQTWQLEKDLNKEK